MHRPLLPRSPAFRIACSRNLSAPRFCLFSQNCEITAISHPTVFKLRLDRNSLPLNKPLPTFQAYCTVLDINPFHLVSVFQFFLKRARFLEHVKRRSRLDPFRSSVLLCVPRVLFPSVFTHDTNYLDPNQPQPMRNTAGSTVYGSSDTNLHGGPRRTKVWILPKAELYISLHL